MWVVFVTDCLVLEEKRIPFSSWPNFLKKDGSWGILLLPRAGGETTVAHSLGSVGRCLWRRRPGCYIQISAETGAHIPGVGATLSSGLRHHGHVYYTNSSSSGHHQILASGGIVHHPKQTNKSSASICGWPGQEEPTSPPQVAC